MAARKVPSCARYSTLLQREITTADVAVVWCFDHRFDLVMRKLLKKINAEKYAPIVVAGGAKGLASPRSEDERQFIQGRFAVQYGFMAPGT